jgi:hypothetical protein
VARSDDRTKDQARALKHSLSPMLGYLHEDLSAMLAGDPYVGAVPIRRRISKFRFGQYSGQETHGIYGQNHYTWTEKTLVF